MIRAAGILLVNPDGLALFLKRGGDGPLAGYWCVPGGKIEDGETPEDAARRELVEETGIAPPDKLNVWTRRIAADAVMTPGTMAPISPDLEEVDFTTFFGKLDGTPTPVLNDEHTAFAWAKPDDPPMPLHPGMQVVLDRANMNELDVARAIAAGELTSPQKYYNMYLFDMRITGTSTAYRSAINEHVYRAPELYLNDEFLARCNGLPVIMLHPPAGKSLDSTEFVRRVVGSIMLPYIKGDEVWGIARIYDAEAVEMLTKEQVSTSPSVLFFDQSVNTTLALDDGSKLLIEGEPSLLDHLAICAQGVWDKGGEPSGVRSETVGDLKMADETEAEMKAKEEKAKADAEMKAKADADAGDKLDKILACMDSVSKRMDEYEAREKARADAEAEAKRNEGEPEQLAADKARKDAEEKAKAEAEEKAKADKMRKDAEEREKRVKDLEAKLESMPKSTADEDYPAMADAQARADSVFIALGSRAPAPLAGETLLAYRKRMIGSLSEHSPRVKTLNIRAINDAAILDVLEPLVYSDAFAAAATISAPGGGLREIRKRDQAGREIISFVGGSPRDWMSPFMCTRRRVKHIEKGTVKGA